MYVNSYLHRLFAFEANHLLSAAVRFTEPKTFLEQKYVGRGNFPNLKTNILSAIAGEAS